MRGGAPRAMRPDVADVIRRYERYVNPARVRLVRLMGMDRLEWEAEGCIVRDAEGREFLDCLGGFGVFSLGHRHPAVVEAVQMQLGAVPISTRIFLAEPLAEMAARLARVAPGDLQFTFACHSGAEAVEGALKMARAATGRTRIVAMEGGFHGKTMGALSVTGRDFFRRPFQPLVPDITHVPFGDAEAAAAAIGADTAAVIVEPIQGEAGIIVPPDGYLSRLRALCDAHGALLIVDEVQTGLGRTGRMFACEHDGVAPDLMPLAKALGGGVLPQGAFMGTERSFAPLLEDPYLHTTTVESLCGCAAACATLHVIESEGLCERAAVLGARLIDGLRQVGRAHPGVVREVRGRGLMIGISFVEDGQGGMVIAGMYDRGILVGFSLNNPQVVRLEPPLIISEREVERVITAFGEAVADAEALSSYG
ncbi:MAG TPA: aminotransferase class III-fold pyridoxal phosphate-dependent enzyme [Limnochordia bacterium]